MSGDAALKARRSWILAWRGWTLCSLASVFLLLAATLLSGRTAPTGAELVDAPPLCSFQLPLLRHGDAAVLLATTRELLEDPEALPFERPAAASIPGTEVQYLVASAPLERPDERMPECGAATYGEYPVRLLSDAWRPFGAGDTLVDLGAGIGYVLAAAMLLTNMSGRGVELSATRARRACEALRLASLAVNNSSLGLSSEGAAAARTFEVWQGDMLHAPRRVLAPPSQGHLVAFVYGNCFGPTFIDSILRMISLVKHNAVTLLISVKPKDEQALENYGLHRVQSRGIHTYVKVPLSVENVEESKT